MRKLKTRDIPAFCRCLKKLGLKDKAQQLAKDSDDLHDAFDKGFDLIWSIFDMATESAGENLLYDFLSGPFEMTAQEVEDLDLAEFIALCKQLVAENDLSTFFKSAVGSMK